MAKKPGKWDTLKTVAIVGTHLPRRCGIATFSADLAGALETASPGTDCWALAINDQTHGPRYPHRVKFEVNHNRLTDYRLAAEFLNMSKVDIVCLQHEYGIFGGPDGQHILELLRRVHVPIVATLHTVLDKPTDGQRRTLGKIAEVCDRLIVMAQRGVEFLEQVYGVPAEKIVHIPHGIPDVPFVDPNYYKDQYGVEGKKVILTFGLLSPGKGIETMIEALPTIVKARPDVVYIVLGATHPHVQMKSGEDYRTSLQRLAEKRGVGDHVIFYNRFVELNELCEFLGAADVYVTPYLNPAQIVSGTLAYAMGAGNAVVSTPYWGAQEMLADDRGRFAPFGDSAALAATIIDLFDHPTKRHAMRKRAYTYTRSMIWPRVAQQYLNLLVDIQKQRQTRPRPVFPARRASDRKGELVQVRLDHLRAMTDDTGMFQHARGVVPNRGHGYCTDDNARALIVVFMARQQLPGGAGCSMLASRYLSFLEYAFDPVTGRFKNFMAYDRRWLEAVGSQDSHGRAVWALGEAVARSEATGRLTLATDLLHQALPALIKLTHPRTWAYGLIGLHAYRRRFAGDSVVRRACEKLGVQLLDLFRVHVTDDWPWPQECVTYDNARLPQALMLCGKSMADQSMIDMALKALDWLITIQTAPQGHFSPIGNKGWYPKGGAKARFDQQPIEAGGMIDACLLAADITGDEQWLNHAHRCFNWFLGDNDVRVPLCDPATGGCCDGLHAEGTSDNQGAESTIAWLMSVLAMHEHDPESALTPGIAPGVGQEPTTAKRLSRRHVSTDQTVVTT